MIRDNTKVIQIGDRQIGGGNPVLIQSMCNTKTEDVKADVYKRQVISCLVNLARELDIQIVVEGIETYRQIEYLKILNCDVVQGYFFSKPLPEEEFGKWSDAFDFEQYGG